MLPALPAARQRSALQHAGGKCLLLLPRCICMRYIGATLLHTVQDMQAHGDLDGPKLAVAFILSLLLYTSDSSNILSNDCWLAKVSAWALHARVEHTLAVLHLVHTHVQACNMITSYIQLLNPPLCTTLRV